MEKNIGEKKQYSLSTKILFAMLFGAIFGLLLKFLSPHLLFLEKYFTDGILQIGGAIFLNLMKMLVAPLVLVSIVCGICSLDNFKALGRIGTKAITLFILTTVIGVILALFFANISHIGVGMHLPLANGFNSGQVPTIQQFLINLFPSNAFAALSEGNVLQIIVFALLFGVAINLAGEHGARINSWLVDIDAVLMKLIMLVMRFAPYGVFCLIAILFAKMGGQLLIQVLNYLLVVVFVLVLHSVFVLGSFLYSARLNPITFFRKMGDVFLFAFSTSSSNATLPLAIEAVEDRLGLNEMISSFVLSLGININKNGTAIMQGVATVFIAHAYGIELSMATYLAVILTTTLAAISTAGVPSVGVVALIVVLKQAGLPLDGIALIIGVDRILDMMRTSVNVIGSTALACVIGKTENKLDMDKYRGL